MDAGFATVRAYDSGGNARLELLAPCAPPEPCGPAELRAVALGAFGGKDESDACERLLAFSARAEGAYELAIGDGLAALTVGDRLMRLGYSNLGDYAREVLGISERTAQAMARLSRELRRRPLLRAAFAAGEVKRRNAETVLPIAVGGAEALWVERARTGTVRQLEAAVRRRSADDEGSDEEWTRLRVRLAPEDRATVDEALAVAGKVLSGAPRVQRLEAMAQEYLGAHPVEAGDDGAAGPGTAFGTSERDRTAALDRFRARLEEETDRWAFLAEVPSIPAPDRDFDAMTAEEIDAELRTLAARRDRWDALVGWCALVVRESGLWRVAGFASFDHYCTERLGLAPRTVEQRASLERRLWQAPALRAARDGGLPYEKVRLLSKLPDAELPEWLPRAWAMTCVALRRALEDHDEAQMRAARTLRVRVPARVAVLLAAAFRAVREAEGRLMDDGKCLVKLSEHFLAVWKPVVKQRKTFSRKILERDLGCCQVPGCSRRAVHAHHIIPRAHGGTDAPWNLVGLCAAHHLFGIHGGYLRVRGRAPGALVWEVGGRAFRPGAEGPRDPGRFSRDAMQRGASGPAFSA